jgi:phytoene synthase
MDLEADLSEAPDTYATFADLYRYCYLVASVVGLVCIRIFGYSDPRAENSPKKPASPSNSPTFCATWPKTPSATASTCPLEDLARHHVTVDQLLHHSSGIAANERALLQEIADRAEHYYQSARQLLPLIDPESRPALWVLVTIYHQLLKRIEKADYDVFSNRAPACPWGWA